MGNLKFPQFASAILPLCNVVFKLNKAKPEARRLTTWGSCVAEVAFAFEAFPVIIRNADSLLSTGKVLRFTATLFSHTTKNRKRACVK